MYFLKSKSITFIIFLIKEAHFISFFFIGEVQRKIGLKALELGGNAVIGYEAILCNFFLI